MAAVDATPRATRQRADDGARRASSSPARPIRSAPACVADGVNLCVYSKRATGIDVLLFDGADDLVAGPRRSASTRT